MNKFPAFWFERLICIQVILTRLHTLLFGSLVFVCSGSQHVSIIKRETP